MECFYSRKEYIESLVRNLEKVDEMENLMKEGNRMKTNVPEWLYDDVDAEKDNTEKPSSEMDLEDLIKDSLDTLKDLTRQEKSCYMKLFHFEDGVKLGIQHVKLKKMAAEKGGKIPKFPRSRSKYPTFVQHSTQTFSRVGATGASGSDNTCPGYCTLIPFKKLPEETRKLVLEVLELEEDPETVENNSTNDDEQESQQDDH